MLDLYKNIRKRRIELGLTQEDVAQKLGYSGKSMISKIEKGKVDLSQSKISEFARILETTESDLMGWIEGENAPVLGKKNMRHDHGNQLIRLNQVAVTHEEYEKIIKKYRDLDQYGKDILLMLLDRMWRGKAFKNPDVVEPIHTVRKQAYPYLYNNASAGAAMYLDGEIPVKNIMAPVRKGTDFIIGINGDSMLPEYESGDMVYVRKTTDLKIGDIGIFMVGGSLVIKKYGKDRLISLNKDYEDIYPSDDEPIKTFGKVLGKVELA